MSDTVWTVPGTVVYAHDGDSVMVDLELGWHVTLRSMVRIDGLASPELKTPEGKAARDYAVKLLSPGTAVTIVSKKLLGTTEKYGRCLASVSFRPDPARAIDGDFALAMIAAGHGVAWDGSGKQPTA